MRNKKFLSLYILLGTLSVSPLFGCSSSNEIKVKSLSTALRYLYNKKNYTLSYQGDMYINHSYIFTESSVGIASTERKTINNFFIKDKGGVYRLSYDDAYYASEYLTYGSDLYSDNYYSSFYHLGKDFVYGVDSSIETMKITDKTYRMGFLKVIGYTEKDIVSLGDLIATYSEKTVKFDITYNGNKLIYIAKDFGSTVNGEVKKFLESGGGHYVPNTSLKKMRELIRSNNFRQAIYQFGEDETTTGYIAYAVFHPHYYYSYYISAPNVYTGAIALNSRATEDHPDLYGCYYFSLVYSESSVKPTIIPTPVYSEPDVVSFYHYPTFLAWLDNLQFSKSWDARYFEDIALQGEGYTITNSAVLNDFASNFSISSSFSGQVPVALGIDYVSSNKDEDIIIYFYYRFNYGNYSYIMPIPLFGFGKSNNSVLDLIFDSYND